MVLCDVCEADVHEMDTFAAQAFNFDTVCVGCVASFLETGDWTP